jgi:hypothetical protein
VPSSPSRPFSPARGDPQDSGTLRTVGGTSRAGPCSSTAGAGWAGVALRSRSRLRSRARGTIAVSGHSPLDIRHAAGQGDVRACAQFVARDNAAEATMNTSTTTMETAAHAGRGFCLGEPTQPAHRPDGLRPPDGEQAANQRLIVRRPESKFLSLICIARGGRRNHRSPPLRGGNTSITIPATESRATIRIPPLTVCGIGVSSHHHHETLKRAKRNYC